MTPTPELLLQDAAWLRGPAKRLASPADRADLELTAHEVLQLPPFAGRPVAQR